MFQFFTLAIFLLPASLLSSISGGKAFLRGHISLPGIMKQSQTGSFLNESPFKPGIREAKEMITYCEQAAHGILGHLVNLPILQLGKVRPKTFFNSPEMAQFLRSRAIQGPGI